MYIVSKKTTQLQSKIEMAILLEASRLVLRFKPDIELATPGSVVKVCARAYVTDASASPPEPWQRPTFYKLNHQDQIAVSEGIVEREVEADGGPGLMMVRIDSFKFQSFGADITNIDETEVSSLLLKSAIVEIRLATGILDGMDPVLGYAQLPLRKVLDARQLNISATLLLSSTTGNETSNSILLNDGRSSEICVHLFVSNDLFAFLAGGLVLTLGDGFLEASSPATEAILPSTRTDPTSRLGVCLQQHTETTDGDSATNTTMVISPGLIVSGAWTHPGGASALSGNTTGCLDCCRLSLSAQTVLFAANRTMLNVARHPVKWVLVLTLRHNSSDELIASALVPAPAVLLGSSQTLNLPFCTSGSDADQDGFNLVLTCATTVFSFASCPTPMRQGFTIQDCIPPKRLFCKKTWQNADVELRLEVDNILSKVLVEHDVLCDQGKIMKRDPNSAHRQLKLNLDQDTISHMFRLGLTPHVQRAIRKHYPAKPSDAIVWEIFTSECYMHVMGMANSFLERRIGSSPCSSSDVSTILGQLLARSRDAEANSSWAIATNEHKTRLSLAILRSNDQAVVASAWFDIAKSLLWSRGAALKKRNNAAAAHKLLDDAHHTLNECLMCGKTSTTDAAICLKGAVLLEQGKIVEAETVLMLCTTTGAYDTVNAALLCVIADMCGDEKKANNAAIIAAHNVDLAISSGEHRAIAALQKAAEYLSAFTLTEAAIATLTAVDRSLRVIGESSNKHAYSHCPSTEPLSVAAQRHVIRSRLSSDFKTAAVLMRAAVETHGTVTTWTALGDTLYCSNSVAAASGPYKHALTCHAQLLPRVTTPLCLCTKYAKCLLETNRNLEAQDSFAASAQSLQAASLWLGAGAAAVRRASAIAAVRCLHRATIRSPRSARPYGLLALLDVTTCGNVAELCATNTLEVAIRLGLDDARLLRELGNAKFQLGRYSAAEALLRRAVAVERKKGAQTHALKRLVDVIAAQGIN
mmetsp:Transcript_15947/g.47451  ORF Transcript_15947/g.47451 Transcript_15947/m.47451 type:complete len:982 (-) Transcript_15947:3-2948(-)